MYSFKTLVFFGIVISALASCPKNNYTTIKLPGNCPTIRYINNVDFSKAKNATFYRYLTSKNVSSVGCLQGCNTLQFLKQTPEFYKISECCPKNGASVCNDGLVGGGNLVYDKNGIVTYSAFGSTSLAYILGWNPRLYYIYYSCNVNCDGSISETVLLSFTNPQPTRKQLQKALDILDEFGISTDHLFLVPQGGNCLYGQ